MSGKIGIASDHAGFQLKARLIEEMKALSLEVVDLGPTGEERVDYPDFGFKLAEAITKGEVERGIAICGSGIGISIALNRYKKIRAALCHDETSARLARTHNDANVLVLGSRLIGMEVALSCLHTFLVASFEGGRHAGRVEKLSACGV